MKKIFLLLMLSLVYSMSMKEFFDIAKNNDIGIATILKSVESITPNYTANRPETHWKFTFGAGVDMFLNGSVYPAIEASGQKLVEGTGSILGVGLSRTKSTQTGIESQRMSISLTQPIGENHFGYQYHLAEEMRQLKAKYDYLNFFDLYEDRATELLVLYHDWYLSYMEMDTERKILKEYEKLLVDIKDRRKSHIARDIEVNKVQIQVLEKTLGLMAKEQLYFDYSEKVASVIGKTFKDEMVPEKIEVMDINTKTRGDNVFTAKQELERIINSLNVLLVKDSLSFPLSIGLSWQNTETYGGSASPSSKIYAGLGFSFPYSTEKELSALRLAQLAYDELLLTHRQQEITRKIKLSELERNIKAEKTYYSIYKQKVSLLEAIAKEEKQNYLRGQATLNQLIQAINDLSIAHQQLLKSQVQLEKLQIQWLSLNDLLMEVF